MNNFICPKLVLPTVYSDALSYEEDLSKLWYFLKQNIENTNKLSDIISDFLNKFDNELSETVKQELNEMLENGDFDKFFKNIIPNDTMLNTGYYGDGLSSVNLPTNAYLMNGLKRGATESKFTFGFVGDSILYGSNQYSDNMFYNKFKEHIKSMGDCYNYSIPGENIYDFASDDYILSQHYSQDEYPWIIAGKTWKEIVLANKPNVLFICFGMNVWGDGTFNFRNRTSFQLAINFCSANKITPILVTPFMPKFTENDFIHVATSDCIRELAKSNNCGLIDCNLASSALSRLRIGGKYTYNYSSAFIDSINSYAYNFEMKCVLDWEQIQETPIAAYCRALTYNNIQNILTLGFRYYENKKQFYYNEHYTGINNPVIIDLSDSNEYNLRICNNVLSIDGKDYTLYSSYGYGAYDFRQFNPTTIAIGKLSEQKYRLQDDVMVGKEIAGNLNGNGINHPTAYALNTIYNPMFIKMANILLNWWNLH